VLISRIRLKNWRNFRELDVPLRDVSYLLGPNASGKSNFLDLADDPFGQGFLERLAKTPDKTRACAIPSTRPDRTRLW